MRLRLASPFLSFAKNMVLLRRTPTWFHHCLHRPSKVPLSHYGWRWANIITITLATVAEQQEGPPSVLGRKGSVCSTYTSVIKYLIPSTTILYDSYLTTCCCVVAVLLILHLLLLLLLLYFLYNNNNNDMHCCLFYHHHQQQSFITTTVIIAWWCKSGQSLAQSPARFLRTNRQ